MGQSWAEGLMLGLGLGLVFGLVSKIRYCLVKDGLGFDGCVFVFKVLWTEVKVLVLNLAWVRLGRPKNKRRRSKKEKTKGRYKNINISKNKN